MGAARRWIGWIAAAAVVAALLAYAFWPRPVLVDMAEVRSAPMTVTVEEEGRTRVREIYTVSAPVTGRLLRVEKKAGDSVTGGTTVVAEFEPSDPVLLDVRSRAEAEAAAGAAEAALSLARADRDRAQAERDLAASDLNRIAELARRGAVSAAERDRARLGLRAREAALATAQAALAVRAFELQRAQALLADPARAAEDGAERCCVPAIAPVTGQVLRILVASEGVVPAGTPILEIGDAADLEIVVELLSSDAVQVTAGQPAAIDGWGGETPLRAVVRRVEPFGFTKVSALGVEEQRVAAILDFADGQGERGRLAHGFRVRARIEVWRGETVLQAPQGALFRAGGAWAVYRIEDGRARLRTVEIGRNAGGSVQIMGGLEAGDRLVLHPSDRVGEGVRVAPRE